MQLTTVGFRARLALETYEDLLAVRALPEYQFVTESDVECDPRHLELIGLEPPIAPVGVCEPSGFLFDYQSWIVELALDRERFAVFADTGLGKTLILLDWTRCVTESGAQRTLIVAPLNVVAQTIREAEKFYGVALPVHDLRERPALERWLIDGEGVGITNYEKVDGSDGPLPVQAVVLDESSVLKSSMGARRTAIMKAFRGVRWKLCCSATPAPNDRMEYAEHAYFLDVVRSTREFLAAFFVNRDGEWMLKAHGEKAFYRHLAAWSVFMRDPKAYGFADHLADLPPMSTVFPTIPLTVEQRDAARGYERGDPSLFGVTVGGVTSRTKLQQIAHGFVL